MAPRTRSPAAPLSGGQVAVAGGGLGADTEIGQTGQQQALGMLHGWRRADQSGDEYPVLDSEVLHRNRVPVLRGWGFSLSVAVVGRHVRRQHVRSDPRCSACPYSVKERQRTLGRVTVGGIAVG